MIDNEIKETLDNGESEVQVATIGEVVGTGADGKPVEQNVTEESLQKLAELHKDEEILVDADHESEIGDKTEAKGWLSKLFVKPGIGLFGTIKWTDIGKKLIENRVFRWLSPSWYLDKDTREPVALTSVALTNKPSQAGRIEPIVNSAPMKIEQDEGIENMTKEELKALILETVAEAKAAEEVKEEKKEEEVKEEVKEEVVDNACGEAKNEEPKTESETAGETKEEVKEEVKEETKKEETTEAPKEEVKEEVIKLEALNSAPKTDGLDIVKGGMKSWEKLSGKDFCAWVDAGMK